MPKIAAPVTGLPGKAGDAAVPLPEGQDLAEGGKDLPDAVLGLEGKGEEEPGADTDSAEDDASAEEAPAPPYAWFAIAPPPAAQPETKAETGVAVTVEAGGKRARREIQLPEAPITETSEPATGDAKAKAPGAGPAAAATSPVPAPVVPEAKPQSAVRRGDVQRQPKTDAAAAAMVPAARPAPSVPDEVPVDESAAAVAATPADTGDTTAKAASRPVLAQAPRELRQAAAEAPVVRITLDRPVAPQNVSIADVTRSQRQLAAAASQPVAEQAAVLDAPQPRAVTSQAGDPQVDLSTVAAPATGTQTAAAVTATGQGQDAVLDTRHQQWTAKMIDKMEALQEGGPVRETRLSLMPEGLGKVDIAIRQDDAGSLHVEFNTDTQAARQLIADAQPKLAEIAQERGIRLGSTSVESNLAGNNGGANGGTGAGSNANSQTNQGQRGDAQPQRNQPSAPPSARREAQTSTQDDERIA
ncbi:flagellar hook-length control protein FliK [Sphingomonas sp. HITSZ_GF]|uniref:flagellar hook-length control protein FliK n=1 Tax=Sphingomonas sp. HITSZ_GF TaxID=3037247 RepID=UPI00240E4531|nr:flagellar hook-length control protein FliK [Sphingomonas sp. HITSZ_GF]MDG2533748.1 flagellar hook-length control protein FliK [Sphingomonas sp. HITSZ_GF]